ncbi:MAG: hypothetical protein JWO32_1422 [Bacteroidetes bacterium]|nr:hypothetical protein [Bacteroidota bacterium]
MNKILRVALNMSQFSVPDKINKATAIVAAISANTSTFASPNPTLASVNAAIATLQIAWNNAQDGGKSKKAIMHDKEGKLMKLLIDLSHYVEGLANGDESIVHLAGMDVKQKPMPKLSDFEVMQLPESGSVKLRVRAHPNSMYKFQYSADGENNWIDARITTVTKAVITGLQAGVKYFFRVVFLDKDGEHPNTPASLYVN